MRHTYGRCETARPSRCGVSRRTPTRSTHSSLVRHPPDRAYSTERDARLGVKERALLADRWVDGKDADQRETRVFANRGEHAGACKPSRGVSPSGELCVSAGAGLIRQLSFTGTVARLDCRFCPLCERSLSSLCGLRIPSAQTRPPR